MTRGDGHSLILAFTAQMTSADYNHFILAFYHGKEARNL